MCVLVYFCEVIIKVEVLLLMVDVFFVVIVLFFLKIVLSVFSFLMFELGWIFLFFFISVFDIFNGVILLVNIFFVCVWAVFNCECIENWFCFFLVIWYFLVIFLVVKFIVWLLKVFVNLLYIILEKGVL